MLDPLRATGSPVSRDFRDHGGIAPLGEGLHRIVDSKGLSIVGESERTAAKRIGRSTRGWKKLLLGVDGSGVIMADVLTDAHVDDATTGIAPIEAVGGDVASVTGHHAYDTIAIYEAAGARGATVVVPPTKATIVTRYLLDKHWPFAGLTYQDVRSTVQAGSGPVPDTIVSNVQT